MNDIIIVGCVADNPFVEDVIQHVSQQVEYSDLISLKSFLNSEFCPRFIVDESNFDKIGNQLEGKKILIVSSSIGLYSRNDLAMRNFLIARAAKDNGAERVILLEPDLYYSAQDRGPRKEHGLTGFKRDMADYKKFDGQPFSSRLYADLLLKAGIDEVVTIHNHSCSVSNMFMDRFSGHFHNLKPSDLYAGYLQESDIVNNEDIILCAPDKGAISFAKEVQDAFTIKQPTLLTIDKERRGERDVCVRLDPSSNATLDDIKDKDVVVIDDMVRTGKTIQECCRYLKKANPRKIVFVVTHFYSSQEGRINLNDPSIDEIVTTNTIPQILNRDMQGRLRHKMVVLLIERWISSFIVGLMDMPVKVKGPLYRENMSSKNPRWKGKMGPLFS